jgi:hypothetical protein
MKIITGTIILILTLLAEGTLSAQSVEVASIGFGTGVENRQLVGADTVFVNSVETIYCFTRIAGAAGMQQVVHNWYYKDQPRASIKLPVESGNWRTWSSKTIPENWTGRWRVIVEDGQGNILANKTFHVVKNGG